MSRERQHFCHKGSFIFVEASFCDQLATILWEVTIQWTGPQVKRKGTGSFLLYSCPFLFRDPLSSSPSLSVRLRHALVAAHGSQHT